MFSLKMSPSFFPGDGAYTLTTISGPENPLSLDESGMRIE